MKVSSSAARTRARGSSASSCAILTRWGKKVWQSGAMANQAVLMPMIA